MKLDIKGTFVKIYVLKVIILLLLISLAVAIFFLVAFIWGVQDGQFDDDYAPPRRILFDLKDINHID